ncbi:hypothetical protein HQN59_22065 [Schlegelella sp. ID0723]|uniref:Uncharacterized protein n=1 Tax=Piscinibacter koreensis TaxID=2742824 RepID=A0A7Y6NSB8_9BURK|nr:hypothetical protein [Schlegelella koreensis]
MYKHVLALASVLAFGAAGPVLAADAQTAEKNSPPPRSTDDTQPSPAARCPAQQLVLPLDHGPRAQSTPYLNRLRAERHAAQVKACVAVGK